MGFFSFFAYRHPILNFFFHDPQDKLKGFLRCAVILNVLTLTFTFTIINDQLISHGEQDTPSDLSILVNDQRVTSHLIITVVFTVFIFVLEWINEFIYGITTWGCMNTPCCFYFKYVIYTEALWIFLINIIIYAALLRTETQLFVGWMFCYALYTLIVSPVWILFAWFVLGGKEKARIRDLETPLRPNSQESPSNNSLTYV